MAFRLLLLAVGMALAGYAVFGPEIRVRYEWVKKASPSVVWSNGSGLDPSYGMTVRQGRLLFIGPTGAEISDDEFKALAFKSLTRPAYGQFTVRLNR